MSSLEEIKLREYSTDEKPNIERIFEKIPQQGPLEFFVHHNTLHHYENMNFFDAVKLAALEYGTRAFMSEAFYVHKYQKGLITEKSLHQEIERFIERNNLQLTPDIIWRLLSDQTHKPNAKIKHKIDNIQNVFYTTVPLFYSNIIKDDDGIDIDFHTSGTIYHFMSSYFDFGSASWTLENREKGMWKLFCELNSRSGLLDNRYRKTLSNKIKQMQSFEPMLAIEHFLELLQVDKKFVDEFLFSLCLKHKGWAGFVKSLVKHPEYIKDSSIIPDLTSFVAVILSCEYSAILTFSKERISIPREKRVPQHNTSFLSRYVYNCDKYPELKSALESALPFLTDFNRQEIFHRAYENTLYQKFINAYPTGMKRTQAKPTYQIILCMDDREESMRRYLEMDLHCETFGSAGHFGLNIAFKGFFDARYRALCPVVVSPEFEISERAISINLYKLKLINMLNTLRRYVKSSSKRIIGAYIVAALSSIFRLIPFIIDVIDPRIILRIKKRFSDFLQSAVVTELVYKKEEGAGEGIDQSRREVFAESFLSLIGLTENFAPYIFIMGHGSMSLNNPHRAAYDCGACGGGIGAVNARLMASILNEPETRQALAERNLHIPDSCRFIGAYHNTCSDEIDFFDLPKDKTLDELLQRIQYAAILDSQERSRRFRNIPLKQKPEYYFKAVRARALDIRQPRAEYGHSTNAFFIIGKRDFTHDLFLDRRAFLLSYNHEQDKDLTILTKLLTATIPVISGINLEYYFSYIDNEYYGSGTKLPHNVSGLVGVMNGHLSDLRAGLPWQMVEIHQPVRLFLLVAADLAKVKELLTQEQPFTDLIHNEWIRFSVHDIESNTLWIYIDHRFEQVHEEDSPPDYLPQDDKILSIRNHLAFGHIKYGN